MSNTMPTQFFWIAEYSNGEALPRFDPESGHENIFTGIDQSRLKRFHFFDENKNKFSLELKKGQRLIFYLTPMIKQFTFRICLKCNHKWQAKADDPKAWFAKTVMQEVNGKKKPIKYQVAVCPKCGEHNTIVCPKCNQLVTRKDYLKDERICDKCKKIVTKALNRNDPHICVECRRFLLEKYCLKCGQVFSVVIERFKTEERSIGYNLGYQETIKGVNHKVIMHIKNGIFWVETK